MNSPNELSTRNEGVVLELDPNIVKEDLLGIDNSVTNINGKQEHNNASGVLHSLAYPNL